MTPTLTAAELRKSYGGTTVLDGFEIELQRGAIHGLLGPNGSGKTTCLHILTGLLDADDGWVEVDGAPITSKSSRAAIGFAPDDLPLPASMTGREYLRFHDAMRRRTDAEAAAVLASAFGLEHALDQQLVQYSHGMRRKIQLVAAVMHGPELLVLDEPFRGLDPDASESLRALLHAFAGSGRAVLIATHDMLRAERDCSAVTILHEGRIVATGAVAELVDHTSTLEDVFLQSTGLDRRRGAVAATLSALFPRSAEVPA